MLNICINCFLWSKWECVCAKQLQPCLTLCDPMDHSLPGSSVHRILQARIQEWVAMPFSWKPSQPRDWTHVSYVYCTGKQHLYQEHHLGHITNKEWVHSVLYFQTPCVCVYSLSRVGLFVSPWTHQALLFWSRLPSPTPGIFPTQESNQHASFALPALAGS